MLPAVVEFRIVCEGMSRLVLAFWRIATVGKPGCCAIEQWSGHLPCRQLCLHLLRLLLASGNNVVCVPLQCRSSHCGSRSQSWYSGNLTVTGLSIISSGALCEPALWWRSWQSCVLCNHPGDLSLEWCSNLKVDQGLQDNSCVCVGEALFCPDPLVCPLLRWYSPLPYVQKPARHRGPTPPPQTSKQSFWWFPADSISPLAARCEAFTSSSISPFLCMYWRSQCHRSIFTHMTPGAAERWRGEPSVRGGKRGLCWWEVCLAPVQTGENEEQQSSNLRT